MTDRPDEPPSPTPPPTRRIVVHAAVLDGVSRLFALSAARAREAVGEIAEGEEAGWEIVEQEVDVFEVPVAAVGATDGPEIRWTCPACGAAWQDPAGPDDEFPVLLLCDCGGTANTWCLGSRG